MAETGPNWRPETLAAALCGALVALGGYPPAPLWPLAIVGPALVWAAGVTTAPRRAWAMGFAYGTGFFAGLTYWLVHTLSVYGGLPTFVSVPVYLLLCLYLALYPAACAGLVSIAARRSTTGALMLAPLVWTALEWLRARLFTGFGWGDTPQALWETGWALKLAPMVGSEGVGLILCLIATPLAWLLVKARGQDMRPDPRWPALAAVAGLVATVALPLMPNGKGPVGGALNAAIVQGNIEQAVKWSPAHRAKTIKQYLQLSLEADDAIGGADLILWPETAVPLWVQDPSPERDAIGALARQTGAALVFGAPAYARTEKGELTNRNAVFLMDERGELGDRYDKVHLVPFGEYVPMPDLLSFVGKLTQAAGNFTPGETQQRFAASGGGPVVGPLICFESTFTRYGAAHAAGGAQVLALVTNDAWFGRTSAPWQHLAYSAWRAAETGLPLLRTANTGVSAIFDGEGRMSASTDFGVAATLTARVEYPRFSRPPQLFVAPLIGPACAFLAALGLFVMLRSRKKK